MIPAPYTLPMWLADDQQLRDEAVLFGLSAARPDEKIASIQLAFAALTAPLEKQIEYHHAVLNDLDGFLHAVDQPAATVDPRKAGQTLGGWPVGTCLAGLLLSLGLSLGVYLGTFALTANALPALLLTGLTGGGGCVAALLVSQATYRQAQVRWRERQRQTADSQKQQTIDRAIWQQQKQARTEQLYQAEALLNQHNAHRDALIRLFESEFNLARSLRQQQHRLADY